MFVNRKPNKKKKRNKLVVVVLNSIFDNVLLCRPKEEENRK